LDLYTGEYLFDPEKKMEFARILLKNLQNPVIKRCKPAWFCRTDEKSPYRNSMETSHQQPMPFSGHPSVPYIDLKMT